MWWGSNPKERKKKIKEMTGEINFIEINFNFLGFGGACVSVCQL